MTLSKKYDNIMSRIEVTPEMRQRVLENIQTADIPPAPKVIRFPQWKRYLSIAACFAVLLIGSLVVPTLFNQQEDPPLKGVESIYDCSSIEDLSQIVGFPVSDIANLPFKIESKAYTSYFAELAQVSYSGSNGERAIYRKAIGADDNSGHYDAYDQVQDFLSSNLTVTLKGSNDTYELALWTDGVYSYSIWLSTSISETEWETVLTNPSE